LALAEDTPKPPEPALPAAMIVLDASSSMNNKVRKAVKLTTARSELGPIVKSFQDKLALGLLVFGHRKASSCSDTEILAKPGELTAETEDKLTSDLKAQGEAPIAASLIEAAKTAPENARLDIVLVADGGDSCDVDLCSTAEVLKEKQPGLRIHVIGFNEKATGLETLSCAAAATGGDFITATNSAELKHGIIKVLTAAAEAPAPAPATAQAPSPPANGDMATGAIAAGPAGAAGVSAPEHPAESAITNAPGQTLAQRTAPPKSAVPSKPVPVTFKALATEGGPKLQTGLTWRVYTSAAAPDGGQKLVSTHREAMPTAALMPGEYFVNAAYGLSNLTKKITVESGHSLEETFVLNTGGLKLGAVFASGEALPEGAVRFDILSDEEDQFGNRRTILANAKPATVIRLNAGAYHIESLYGDANGIVRADVTVEPGKVTEATVKHSGAKTTFKLVQSLGGEALADTKWKILTSAGDVVKENAGALPTHILAAGSYAVVADHNGLSYTRKFSIDSPEPKQIEVVVEDGPTSPEALQALLEPPEPPPSAAGLYGEGGEATGTGLGFDGFSAAKPADPNAPLINPGALFRPSAR
jgi:hypothetical protein